MACNGVAHEYIVPPDDDVPDDDGDDDEHEDLLLLDFVECEQCHTLLATRNEFIQDLFPQSNEPYHVLLFHTALNVDYGKVENRVVIAWMTEIDGFEVSCIYCERCQKFAGWRIVATYQGDVQVQQFGENPVFRPGQCILLYRSNGDPVV